MPIDKSSAAYLDSKVELNKRISENRKISNTFQQESENKINVVKNIVNSHVHTDGRFQEKNRENKVLLFQTNYQHFQPNLNLAKV